VKNRLGHQLGIRNPQFDPHTQVIDKKLFNLDPVNLFNRIMAKCPVSKLIQIFRQELENALKEEASNTSVKPKIYAKLRMEFEGISDISELFILNEESGEVLGVSQLGALTLLRSHNIIS